MRYLVPDYSVSSSGSEDSFYSTNFSPNLRTVASEIMSDMPYSNNNIAMPEVSTSDPFAGLSLADKEEILRMLEQKKKRATIYSSDSRGPSSSNKVISLPKWNGLQEDFRFFVDRLRLKVENEMLDCEESSSICIEIIDT